MKSATQQKLRRIGVAGYIKSIFAKILKSPRVRDPDMQLTQRAKLVDRKPMTWLEKIYLWNIFKGMWITLKHFFKRKVTIQYPEQKRSFSKVFRGLHIL